MSEMRPRAIGAADNEEDFGEGMWDSHANQQPFHPRGNTLTRSLTIALACVTALASGFGNETERSEYGSEDNQCGCEAWHGVPDGLAVARWVEDSRR